MDLDEFSHIFTIQIFIFNAKCKKFMFPFLSPIAIVPTGSGFHFAVSLTNNSLQ